MSLPGYGDDFGHGPDEAPVTDCDCHRCAIAERDRLRTVLAGTAPAAAPAGEPLREALTDAWDQAQHADGCRWWNHSTRSLGTPEGRAKADADCACWRKSARAALAAPAGEPASAFNALKAAIQADRSYAWSWQCNLAMAVHDEGVSHRTSNQGAARFMRICFDVDVTEFPEYVALQRQWQANAAPAGEAFAPLKAANLSAALRAIVRECRGPERPFSSDSYLPPHLLELANAALESTETPLQVIEAMRHDEELS